MNLISENGFLIESEKLSEEKLEILKEFDKMIEEKGYRNLEFKAEKIFLCFKPASDDYEIFFESKEGFVFGSDYMSFSLKEMKKKNFINMVEKNYLENVAGNYADLDYAIEIALAKRFCESYSVKEFKDNLEKHIKSIKVIEEELKNIKLEKMLII